MQEQIGEHLNINNTLFHYLDFVRLPRGIYNWYKLGELNLYFIIILTIIPQKIRTTKKRNLSTNKKNVTIFYTFVTICNFFCFAQRKEENKFKKQKIIKNIAQRALRIQPICANYTKIENQKI